MPEPYFTAPGITLWHADALDLPLPDASVDLVVTSPPYFGLRSYQDGGEHYAGQIGSEPTPAKFVDALIAATREMVRVLKPSGSIWVNLGDKYSQPGKGERNMQGIGGTIIHKVGAAQPNRSAVGLSYGNARGKSLIGVPWRYALRCIDDLGLILRAEVIWSKPNGLPESVADRVRRSHETWFHFVTQPRYFSGVDEIREPYAPGTADRYAAGFNSPGRPAGEFNNGPLRSIADGADSGPTSTNPLGKLPGSVWEIATQPLTVPAELGLDHFAAFPMEWPRRIIRGWSPRGVCVECGFLLGARRLAEASAQAVRVPSLQRHDPDVRDALSCPNCGCGSFRPAVIADPFGGTGTTALVAAALGRHGHSVDLSADYCRLARWRVTDPAQRAAAAQVEKPDHIPADQPDLFGGAA